MRKFFGLYDEKEENLLKRKLIEFTGIEHKHIHFLNIYVSNEEYLHVVHIEDGTKQLNKRNLVLLHGLGMSSLSYFKMFKRLSEHFNIFGIDLPGMGCSSRNNIKLKDYSEAEDYFLSRLKICLDKLKLKHFILCAHSFGGYISGLLNIKYPEMVDKLILISPVGLSSTYKEIESTKIEDMLQSISFKIKQAPTITYKLFGLFSNAIFNHICEGKFKGLTNREEFETLRDFVNSQFRKEYSSDFTMFLFFNKSLMAYKPLSFYPESFRNKDVLILYGDIDWSPIGHAEEVREFILNHKFKELVNDSVQIDIVSDSGHSIHTDNYEEMTEKIIKFIYICEEKANSTFTSITKETDVV